MRYFTFGSKITRDINQIAKEVVAADCLSFDYNRKVFRSKLTEYYKEEMHSSDKLIIRKNEIDYYDNRLTDILLSAFIGTLLGLFAGFVDDLTQLLIDSTQNQLLYYVVLIGLMLLFTFLMLMAIFAAIKCFGSISSYQKLHCEEFEKELIEERLREREPCFTVNSNLLS